MGTRGIIGFTVDGKDHFSYNHFDSYPDALGQIMVNFVQVNLNENPDKYKALAQKMKDVKGTKPNDLDKERCKPFTDLGVATQSEDDWYCLLRDTQYNPEAILLCGCYEGSVDFIYDSLFCEYAYVVNFDTGKLEFYQGFQDKNHNKGRFAKSAPPKNDYYPCALVGEYHFEHIPAKWMRIFDTEEEQ